MRRLLITCETEFTHQWLFKRRDGEGSQINKYIMYSRKLLVFSYGVVILLITACECSNFKFFYLGTD